jgi:hypothetical protein
VVALNRKDANTLAVVEGKISLSSKEAQVLINPGSIHTFIDSPFACGLRLDENAIPCNVVVSIHSGKHLGSNLCYKDCEMRLRGITLKGDLIRLPIEDYDIILGMEWLSRHNARVDCKQKIVYFCRHERMS